MPDKVIRVYVFDRNDRPIPGAEVRWTVKHNGETITCGPVTTQGFLDKPADVQIESELDEPFVEITARFKDFTKTDRVSVDTRDHTFKFDLALPEPAAPQPQPTPQPLAAFLYAVVSILGLVGSVVVGWYLLNNPGLLAPNNASARAYFVLLLLLGLSSAAFLFGAMRSTASLRGTHLGAAYEFGGPVVIAIVVVLGGFYLTKTPENISLVVRLRAKEPIVNLTDTWVRVALDGIRRDMRNFSSDGEALIPAVPTALVGQRVVIEFGSRFYRLVSPQASYEVPTTLVIYLDVERISGADIDPLSRCTDSIQVAQFDIAVERCSTALAASPSDFKIANLLAFAQYHNGQFIQAVNTYERAIKLPGADEAMVRYNIAFAQQANKDLKGALSSLELAAGASTGRPALLARIWIAMGSIQQDLWMANPESDDLFDKAAKSYAAFLEIGKPTHWAYAGLACMYAVRAGRVERSDTKSDFELTALRNLEASLDGLRQLKDSKLRNDEATALRREFGPDSSSACQQPLKSAWEHQKKGAFTSALFDVGQ